MPNICYTERAFRQASLDIIEHAAEIIDDYAGQGLTLTLRQLYYRFVAADRLPNSQKSYKRLGSIVNDARLAGMLDWEAIEDRGRSVHAPQVWDSIPDIIASVEHAYTTDRWEEQDYRVEVWVEKQALEAIVAQACDPWRVAYFACKGYTSQSEMWRAAQRFQAYERAGQQPVVIHLGDHDPSGIDMTRDIFDRLNDVYGVDVEVDRIALNMDQVRQHNPPPNPAKLTDSRSDGYIDEHGPSSWELDALEPRTLNTLISDQIEQYVDQDAFDGAAEREDEGRAVLRSMAEKMA